MPPPWIGTAALALPLGRRDVLSNVVWLHIAYRRHTPAKHSGAPLAHVEFLRTLRAMIRSIAARSRVGRDAILCPSPTRTR